MRYRKFCLFRIGPDDNSTFSECFGPTGSRGTEIASGLYKDITEAVKNEGGWGGLNVCGIRGGRLHPLSRREFLELRKK